MRIDTITPEQAALLPAWAQRWIEIGLSTEPADFDRATEAALKAYKLCNLDRPMVILRMGSPYAATLGGILAWAMLRSLAQAGWAKGVKKQVWSQVGSQVRSQVESQVWSQVRSQVWSQVESQVGSQVRSQVRSGVYNARGGAFWAGWCAYVAFMRDVLGWRDPVLERFEIDEALTQSCGWTWWHKNVLAISDRPCALHRDAEGRLHNDRGPSIAYRDGWALWHIHGVAVPQEIVEQPDGITPQRIGAEANAEIRRIMVDRYGLARYLKDSGAKPIDHEEGIGTLLRKEEPGDDPIYMVEVVNTTPEADGSFKHYFLDVSGAGERLLDDRPGVRKGKPSARAAVAATFGMKASQYRPAVET